MTSQPCENGASCIPNYPQTVKHNNRFTCKCQPGYQGVYCEQPIRSCSGYHRTQTNNGIYYIIDTNGNAFPVKCFLQSKIRSWTLIQSYEGKDHLPDNNSTSYPGSFFNEHNPNQIPYRLEPFRIKSIRQNSSIWRIVHGYWDEGCWDSSYVDIDTHFGKCTSCVTNKYNEDRKNPEKKHCNLLEYGSHECQDPDAGGNIDNYGSYCCYNSTSNECPSGLRTRIFLGDCKT